MRSLQEAINEGIFDKDLVTSDESLVIKDWLNTFMPEGKSKYSLHWTIDTENKTISSNLDDPTLEVNAINQSFDGFIGGYKFVNKKGRNFEKIKLYGDIVGLKNIPDGIDEISIYQPNDLKLRPKVLGDISAQLNKLKTLMLLGKEWRIGWKELDLSELNIPVSALYIGALEKKSTVKFNPDSKVDILRIGYGASDGHFANLPIFKTITFQEADFDSAKNFIKNIEDKGKSDFDKVIVNGRYLNKEEKDAIKSMLKDEDTGFSGYTETLKKLGSINNVMNDKDGHNDRFGESLSPGDIVIVCNSTDPKYPSFFDVYKGCSDNGRIRTEHQMMVPPRNVIKLNNPKILDLLK